MLNASLHVPAFKKKDFEDKIVLKKIEKIFLAKRGFVFTMPNPGDAVILLVSGGLDSICLWYLLLKKYQLHVYPIFLSTKPVNKISLFPVSPQKKAIDQFSSFFKKKYPRLFHPPHIYYDLTFLNQDKTVNPDHIKFDLAFLSQNLSYYPNIKKHHLHIINNPTRQVRFMFDAYEFALSLKYNQGVTINTVFCGILKDDGAALREATLTVLRSVNLCFCLILGDFSWQFTGALEEKVGFSYFKKQLVSLAVKNGLPLEKTWSCNNHFFLHCGQCPSCLSRQNVFTSLNLSDKTAYLPSFFGKLTNKQKVSNFINKFLNFKTAYKQTPKSKLSSNLPNQLKNVRLSVSPNTVWKNIDKAVFLLNKNEGVMESLNPVGSFIFNQIVQENEILVNTILRSISNRFTINQKSFKKDTILFIKELLKKGYIKIN